MYLLLLVAAGFAIWGPKVGGYLDLMVLVPAALLILFAGSGRVVVPVRFYVVSASIASLIAIWVGMSILINGSLDPQGVLRSVRGLVTLLVLVPMFYMAASRQIVSKGVAFWLLVIALFFNTAAIYAQVLYVPLQDVMAPLWGFDKPIREVRAFGLTAGYDSAGYLAALLAASALSASLVFRSWGWFFFFIVCAGAVGFTSRTSMLVLGGLVVVVFGLSKADWRGNGVRLLVLALGGVVAVGWYVLPRVSAGVSELAGLSAHDGHDYSSHYATTSLVDVLDRMAVLPQEFATWVIGSGLIVPWSDIGYIRVLHLGGVPLLALMFFFYGYLFWMSRSSGKRLLKSSGVILTEERWLRVWLVVLLSLLLVMFLGNLKNLYFITRGYHEVFIIVVALMLGFHKGRAVSGRAGGIARDCRGCGVA